VKADAGYHPAVEQYLETIYELEEAGVPPIRARLVERLGVSAPAASETVGRLEREGYLTLEPTRVIRLTDTGRGYATTVMRRHRLAERLLVDVLELPWHQAHEEAGRLEHAISDNLERHLVRLLGDPGTCPHGNPIPGSTHPEVYDGLLGASDLDRDETGVVRRIDEQIEAQPATMRLLQEAALMPGRAVTLARVDGEQTHVVTDSGRLRIPVEVAAKVYVSRR
jgi:DtxR family Mn-dependent transcriptional regulator